MKKLILAALGALVCLVLAALVFLLVETALAAPTIGHRLVFVATVLAATVASISSTINSLDEERSL